MNSEQFRKAGYELIEYAARYMETITDREPLPHVTPGWLAKIMPTEAPQKPEGWDSIMKDVEKVIMEGSTHWMHPQFHAYFSNGNSWPSILGDILSNGLGVNGTTWDSCPAVTELELIVVDWAAKFLDLPKFFWSHLSNPESEGGGSIQTSASDAILLGMIAAREDCVKSLRKKFPDKPRAVLLNQMVAYRSSQCHSSVEKGGMIGSMRVIPLPADEKGNVRASTLRNAIITDMEAGFIPYLYVAILGSTGTCAFDDLMELGPVVQEYGMWMHVDAAYGGSCFACPEMRYLMKGMEYAWSLNTNANKWMLCNFDLSFLWVRYRRKLVGCLTGYKEEIWETPEFPIVNLKHYALPSTRRFRALKFWFVVRNYGIAGLQKYHRNHIYLAKLFERFVDRDDRFEVIGPTRVGLVCFRLRATNELNKELLDAINSSRRLHMVPSVFHEKYVIRFATVHQFLNERDVDIAWRITDEFASALLKVAETEHKDEGTLKHLYDKQHAHTKYDAEHPDAQREKEEEEAMRIIKAHKVDEITSNSDFAAVDGSWSTANDESIKAYDEYTRSHPEELAEKQVRGEERLGATPSMLRTHLLEKVENVKNTKLTK